MINSLLRKKLQYNVLPASKVGKVREDRKDRVESIFLLVVLGPEVALPDPSDVGSFPPPSSFFSFFFDMVTLLSQLPVSVFHVW